METIKITDKLTLRQEALRMALERANAGSNIHDAVKLAKEYETFLLGNAELPERDNGMEKYLQEMKDMLFKQHNPWISADSEMKPAKGVQVLCALHYAVNNIVYQAMYYSPETKEWYAGADDDNTNHVVAWCPIVPFSQPTL